MKKIFQKFRNLFIQQDLGLKISTENYWSNVFNSTISDSKWFLEKGISPGRWALGYPALFILYRILNDIKPNNILEFGLGESSKLFFQYKNHFDKLYYVVEHNNKWATIFSNSFYDISDNLILVDLEKIYKNNKTKFQYKDFLDYIPHKKYDFICIDGPFGGDYEGRCEILKIIENDLLHKNFVILLDDTERESEQQTLKNIYRLFERRKIAYIVGEYEGMKKTTIIVSPEYSFLTTL